MRKNGIALAIIFISIIVLDSPAFGQLFDTAVNYDAGDGSYSIYSADLDGDNDNDLAVANQYSNNVSILLNNGNATFQAAFNYGVGARPMWIFAADLDGDGDSDLVTVNTDSDNISILKNNGDVPSSQL